ncbi:MAG: restriction endonuclease [bacterium]
MMANLITLQNALNEIKQSIEAAIKKSGTEGKNNLIRSQKPIKLLHEVVKAEMIRKKVNPDLLNPPLGQSNGELSLAGFFKKKNQDICLVPNNTKSKKETLSFQGILYGQEDKYGADFTEKTLSINVRSQLSSSAKNFDTLYERTFAEALNLHLRRPKMVLGEFYMIAVNEYDSISANKKVIKYKKVKGVAKHIEKYLLSFAAVNNRQSVKADHFKYERVCLLIVDFSKKVPKVYNTDTELKKDNLLPENSMATIQNLSFPSFAADLLNIYSTRFGTGKFK